MRERTWDDFVYYSAVVSTPTKVLTRLHPKPRSLSAWAESIDGALRSLTSFDGVDPWEAWAVVTHALNLQADFEPWRSSEVRAAAAQHNFRTPNHSRIRRRPSDVDVNFTFADLFSGIGGFHLALASQGGSLAFASELDRSTRVTYAANFGVLPFGDIREFTRTALGTSRKSTAITRMLPLVNVIAAGFPCQPFSRAGVTSRNHHGHEHGLDCDTQGTLFEDVLAIARALQPEVLLFENVSNLATHDRGNTIRVILEEINRIGYAVYPEWTGQRNWAVVDSSLVVGQRRKRVYFVAIRSDLAEQLLDEKGPLVLPAPKRGNGRHGVGRVLEGDDTLSESEKFERYGISTRLWKSHLRRERHHVASGNGFRLGLIEDSELPAPTLVARYFKDGKDCLIPHERPSAPPRMLTPLECALLQTFPRNFRIPASKSTAYKQFGNAVTVEVARDISRAVIDYVYR